MSLCPWKNLDVGKRIKGGCLHVLILMCLVASAHMFERLFVCSFQCGLRGVEVLSLPRRGVAVALGRGWWEGVVMLVESIAPICQGCLSECLLGWAASWWRRWQNDRKGAPGWMPMWKALFLEELHTEKHTHTYHLPAPRMTASTTPTKAGSMALERLNGIASARRWAQSK